MACIGQVNRVFGAAKFQFYVQSSTPELETCLEKYRQLGIVDVQPWSLPEPLLHPDTDNRTVPVRANIKISTETPSG